MVNGIKIIFIYIKKKPHDLNEKKIPRKKMVKDEVVDVRNAHLGPPQAKIPSELQINCGYDLFQNFQPFFFSWRSGLNQTPSILQGPSN